VAGFNDELAGRVREFLAGATAPDVEAEEGAPAEAGAAPDAADVAFDAAAAELEAALQDDLPDEEAGVPGEDGEG
jgi:hypothetical protein